MRTVFCITLLFFVTLTTGCGDNKAPGKVMGTVTLDGEPLTNAFIIFRLETDEGALPSMGGTNTSGRYELFYANKKTGAIPGRYKVCLRTGDTDGRKPERVPPKYLSFSTTDLICDVKKGKNVFDITLTSDTAGQIPPAPPQNSKFRKPPGKN
ncbi:MAG: hypothetical protein LBH00_02710 [Planctomycetaceae bacterium]|jgi:hypothetical protein|nr:hypothetical protein [Planctomycetaceae bacterium]